MQNKEKLLKAIEKLEEEVKDDKIDNFLLATSNKNGITLLKNDTISALGLTIAAEEQLRQIIKDMSKLRQAISTWNKLDAMTNQVADMDEEELRKKISNWIGEALND